MNEESTITKTLNSIIAQANLVDKVIVKDARSCDNTADLAKSILRPQDIVIVSEDNGLYDAWNQALPYVESKWVIFLGSGDTLTKNALSTYKNYISNNTCELDFISSRIRKIDANSREKGIYYNSWSWQKFRRYMCTSHVGAIHNINLFKEEGLFSTDYKICSDYELLLRKGNKLKAGFVDRIQAEMLVGGLSESIKAIYETAIIKVKLKTVHPFYAITDFLYASVKFMVKSLIQST